MNTTNTMDNTIPDVDNPGIQLANIRQQKGYTIEYVANKLHLRTRIIELIEAGDFTLLPEAVFIKGYLRSYSKLLGVSPEPFLAVFNAHYVSEKKVDRALWQSKRETHRAEYFVRVITALFAVGVLVAVGVWWQKNREIEPVIGAAESNSEIALEQPASEIKLTDLSKMESLLRPEVQMTPLENQGG